MVLGLLWIIGIYGLCALLVHVVHSGFHRHPKEVLVKHYVLITHNNQLHIEWYMRSLILFSWLKGKEIKVTVMDEGSSDDTVAIVEKMARKRNAALTLYTTPQNLEQYVHSCSDEEIIVLELNKTDDLMKIPLLQ